MLAFLDRVDPEDPTRTPQIADTFALHTPDAPTSVARVLLGLCWQLVTLWQTHAPPSAQAALPPLDLGPLRTPLPATPPSQHQAQFQQAVGLAHTLLTTLPPALQALDPATRQAVQGLLDLLQKVLADETTRTATGQIVERPSAQKGSYRLASAVDTEATFRKDAPDPAVFGYNAAISTTATRMSLIAVLVLPQLS